MTASITQTPLNALAEIAPKGTSDESRLPESDLEETEKPIAARETSSSAANSRNYKDAPLAPTAQNSANIPTDISPEPLPVTLAKILKIQKKLGKKLKKGSEAKEQSDAATVTLAREEGQSLEGNGLEGNVSRNRETMSHAAEECVETQLPMQARIAERTLEPIVNEKLEKGARAADDVLIKEVFDDQGRLLWRRVVSGPARNPRGPEGEGSVPEATAPEIAKRSKKSSSAVTFAVDDNSSGLPSDKCSKKAVEVAVPETPRMRRKSSPDSAPSEDEALTGSTEKVVKNPKTMMAMVTNVLHFLGELESTTIKSNRMREKNTLNEYRGLAQLFLISQAGLILAFILLGVVLINVFALLFVVVLFATR